MKTKSNGSANFSGGFSTKTKVKKAKKQMAGRSNAGAYERVRKSVFKMK